jgi:hypothetical protein
VNPKAQLVGSTSHASRETRTISAKPPGLTRRGDDERHFSDDQRRFLTSDVGSQRLIARQGGFFRQIFLGTSGASKRGHALCVAATG